MFQLLSNSFQTVISMLINFILTNKNFLRLRVTSTLRQPMRRNFSLLKRLNPEEEFALTSTSGTYYKSPEQILSGIYSIQSDIWALGCLLFEMATLRPPFNKGSEFLNAKSIK